MEFIKSFMNGIINTWNQNPASIILTIILLILCVLIEIYYPKFRGFMGEFWIKMELKKLSKESILF